MDEQLFKNLCVVSNLIVTSSLKTHTVHWNVVYSMSLLQSKFDILVTLVQINQKLQRKNCEYFLIHQCKHLFWVLKRTFSVLLSTHNIYVLVEKFVNYFSIVHSYLEAYS